MRKRVFAVWISFILLILCSMSVHAATATNVRLDELGMTVSVPPDYVVFTRDTEIDDPNLSAYGLTWYSMYDTMLERNIYLNAVGKNIDEEIVVTMAENSLDDFNLFSDSMLSSLASGFDSQYEQIGVTVLGTEIYHHAQAKFIKIYISQVYNGIMTVYGLQYYTVYAGKAINITLHSYSGEKLTSKQENAVKSVVDSVKFDADPQTAETSFTPTEAFTYTDPGSQVQFTVPANWEERPMSEERFALDVKFASLENEDMLIFYGCVDLWDQLPASERAGYTRAEYDNSVFTEADVADAFGWQASDVHKATYGQSEYYIATGSIDTSLYGLDFSVNMTCAVRVANGYMYCFQFSGPQDDPLYQDFEQLLNSVIYPPVTSTETTETTETTEPNRSASDFSIGSIILSILITVAVYSLPIIIYRYAIRKSPVNPKKAKKITIIYGIVAFFVMCVLIFVLNGGGAAGGGAVVVWSWINYRILISGYVEEAKIQDPYTEQSPSITHDEPTLAKREDSAVMNSSSSQPAVPQTSSFKTAERPQVSYCRQCGAALKPESQFCHKCGTKIDR